MRRTAAAMTAVLTLVTGVGCGDDDGATGEAITADSPADSPGGNDGQAGAGSASTPAEEPTDSGAAPTEQPGEQHVDVGEFADSPQAEVVATFYEALWTSYQQGKVTQSLARLSSDSALKIFRERVRDYQQTGHTVADLVSARVSQVKEDTVFVCMASASYQRLERRTGAAVNPAEKGFTQYVVTLQRPSSPWKVDTIQGTKNSPCGKAAS